MLEQMTDPDRTILALADDSGCFGVERLPPGPASVGDVVEPPAMALPESSDSGTSMTCASSTRAEL